MCLVAKKMKENERKWDRKRRKRYEPGCASEFSIICVFSQIAHNRLRNRRVALSVNEVRKVAETLRSNSSARRQIQSWPTSPEIPEPHKSTRNRSPSPLSYPKSMNFFGLYRDLIGLFVLAFNYCFWVFVLCAGMRLLLSFLIVWIVLFGCCG